jgi:hypothetical protein
MIADMIDRIPSWAWLTLAFACQGLLWVLLRHLNGLPIW